MTFHGKPNMKDIFKDIHESPKEMTGPIVLLGTLSFFIFYTLPYYNPISDHGWFTDLIVPQTSAVPGSMTANEIAEHSHHAHYLAMGLSVAVATIGILLAGLMYFKNVISAKNLSNRFGFLYDWSLNKFYFDENYNRFLYQPFLRLSKTISWLDWEFYDKYFINGFGRVTNLFSKLSGRVDYEGIDQGLVDGLGRISGAAGENLRKIQTGKLQNYLLYVVASILIIIIVQAF
jgi:NADH-quinone oxidoreductase subunit L